MMSEQMIEEYITIFEQLKSKLKWKVTDNRIIMTIAAMYTMSDKSFNQERFLSIAEKIKKQAGIFSFLKSQSRYTMASSFDMNFTDPDRPIVDLFDMYDEFISAKFKRGIFTYIAASLMLFDQDTQDETTAVIKKAKTIYDGMRKQHPFLTSAHNYPIATLLALKSEDHEKTIIKQLDDFYFSLVKNGFKKGKDLQILSHILSLATEESDDALIERITHIHDGFKLNGIKPKSKYYTVMAILAFIPLEKIELTEVINIYERLNKQKPFRWQKDLNFLLATSFYVSEKLADNQIIETNIFTTLEYLLQVQQAILVASMMGATATSSSSSNN